MTKIKRTTKADIHALIQQVHDAIYNYDGDTGCGPMVAQQLYGLIADLHDVLDGRDAGTTRYRDWIEAASIARRQPHWTKSMRTF